MTVASSTVAPPVLPARESTRITPMQAFNLVSLCLIGLMVAGVGLTQSAFYRATILERQGNDIRDIAEAVAAEHLSLQDMKSYRDPDVQARFERSFTVLRNLSELVSIRVYDLGYRIVWSENPSIIGTRLDLGGAPAAPMDRNFIAFHSPSGGLRHHRDLPQMSLVEFNVPLYLRDGPLTVPRVGGMVAVFRSTESLNRILATGTTLIWLVTGMGGLVLYGALAFLFRSVYRRQQETEMQFSELVTRQQQQQRLVQVEKLSTIGMMIGGIAHQINNPMVGVVNMAQLAEREADDPVRTRELLADIRRAGEHCRTFLQRMLKFTALSGSERKATEMTGLIDDTISLFQQSADRHPRVVAELPEAPVVLDVDPVLVRHAVFNLLSNAAQADTARGTITVRLARAPRAEDSAPGWSLSVMDQGPGLPEDVLDHLFTPFFSTRVEGTGLGLSVVQHVAILHEGQITAANRPGGGAVFTLWLPENKRETRRDTQRDAHDPHRR